MVSKFTPSKSSFDSILYISKISAVHFNPCILWQTFCFLLFLYILFYSSYKYVNFILIFLPLCFTEGTWNFRLTIFFCVLALFTSVYFSQLFSSIFLGMSSRLIVQNRRFLPLHLIFVLTFFFFNFKSFLYYFKRKCLPDCDLIINYQICSIKQFHK